MSEPVLTERTVEGPGRPAVTNEQYWKWLEEMRPFLEQGTTLYYAMDKTGLSPHKNLIYQKYRDDKDFQEKIDALRSQIGELANLIAHRTLKKIHTKLVTTDGDYEMTSAELQVWKTVAEKHRTAQPFFVARTETAEAEPEDFGKVIDVPSIQYLVPDQEVTNAEQKDGDANTPAQDPVQTNQEAAPSVDTPTQ